MCEFLDIAKEALNEQSKEIAKMAENLNGEFSDAVNVILSCTGKVVISGMGKSGHIGNKMMASLASTGTPSNFMHPAEAFHGDLGMIQHDDVVILISYSGESQEVTQLIPSIKSFGNTIIAMCGNRESTLGRNADIFLDISVEKEVCPNNLAPTTSTLVNMAMGDALTVALIHARDFKPMDFARYHPGGSLGRQLLSKVHNHVNKNVAQVDIGTKLDACLIEMSSHQGGVALVMSDNELVGVVTDGDVRRFLADGGKAINEALVEEVMSKEPITISENEKIVEAEKVMHEKKVKALVAISQSKVPVGIVELFH